MDFKMLLMMAAGIALVGLGVMLLSNNFALTLAIASVILAVYFYLQWRAMKAKPTPPYTMLKNRMLRAISQCNPHTLGYLILRGDSDFQRITLGKMVGVITWNLTKEWTEEIKASHGVKGKGWDRLIVIGYRSKYTGVWSWPLVRSFVPIELFAVTKEQLWDKPGFGDIRVRGVSIEPVFLFWMVNSIDLNKDYIAHAIDADVKRTTLETFWDEMPELINNAVKSDGFQMKVKELIADKKRDMGIS